MKLSRNKRIGLAAVAAAALPVTIISVQPTNAATSAGGQDTFRLVEREQSFRFIDHPPRQTSEESPPSAGDEFVFTARLFRAGDRVGTLHANCTFTRRARTFDRVPAVCIGTFVLPRGTIQVQVGGNLGDDVELAITGGTGRFAGAEGTITSVTRGNRSIDTVHLL